jgi:hypothetical protein
MEKNCGNCVFSKRSDRIIFECRFFPPAPITGFVVVSGETWYGQHKNEESTVEKEVPTPSKVQTPPHPKRRWGV